MQGLPQKASKIAHQSEEHPETTPYGLWICQRSSNIFQHETRVSDDSLQSWCDDCKNDKKKTTQSQSCFHFRRDGTIIRMIPNLNIYIHINHNRFTGLQEWLRRISWSIWPICPCRWVALPSLSSMKTASKKQQSWRVFKCHVWLLAGRGCIADYPVENNDVNSQVWLPKKGYVLPRLLLVSCCIQILVA